LGVEPYADGFLDLKKMVSLLRPSVRLNLEMITRDPLKIPCLTDRYWATAAGVAPRDGRKNVGRPILAAACFEQAFQRSKRAA
jgi:hypothetical protein